MKIFRWNKEPDSGGLLADVNLTPLIDVSLVLVIILLLATPLAFESSFAFGRAQTSDEENSEEGLAPNIYLHVRSDAEVLVDGISVAVADLPQTIAVTIAAATNKVVAISCADEVTHGTFVQVMDVAKLSGAASIAIVEQKLERRAS